MAYTKNSLKNEWILSENGITDDSILWAQDFGEYLAVKSATHGKLSTSQLRRFFGQLKRIKAEGFDEKNLTKILMLKAQLAYANGRDIKFNFQTKSNDNQTKIGDFCSELSKAIGIVKEKTHFKNFVNLVEAVVAYHKSKGGE